MKIGVEIKKVEATTEAVSILMEIRLRRPTQTAVETGRIIVNVDHRLSEDPDRHLPNHGLQTYRRADGSVELLTHDVVALAAVK